MHIVATKVAQQTLKCDLGVKYAGPDEQTLDIYHAQVTADAARGNWGLRNLALWSVQFISFA